MKRLGIVLLSILMLFSLFGCTEKITDTPDETDTQATESAAPTETAAAEKATIVYICNSLTNVFCYNLSLGLEELGVQYNYEVISATYDGDGDKFYSLVETYIDEGVDGFILNTRKEYADSIAALVKESGIPCVTESTIMADTDGKLYYPGVELDAYDNGAICAQWIVDNYESVGFEVDDDSKLGLLVVSYSAINSFVERAQGATETLEAAFPECENVFLADTLVQGTGLTAEAAYNETASTLAAHPEIEKWFVVGILDDLAQGAVRAIEDAGLEDVCIVSSVGGEILVQEWASGYEGCWMACGYFEAMDFVKQDVPALMSVINGEAQLEDLFSDWKEDGQTYGVYQIVGTMATIDTYEEVRTNR